MREEAEQMEVWRQRWLAVVGFGRKMNGFYRLREREIMER
jgi:hypothetical protein